MDVSAVSGGRLSGFSDREWGWQMGAISRTYSPVAAPVKVPYQGYLTPMSQRRRFTCEGSDDESESERVADAAFTKEVQLSGAQIAAVPCKEPLESVVQAEPAFEEVGYCYQHLIADLRLRKLAKARLGPNPTLLSLLRLPSEWFDISWMDESVNCSRVREGAWHAGVVSGVRVSLLLYEAAIGVRRFGYGELGRVLLEGPERDWSELELGRRPAWSDTLGGDRPAGNTAFSVDPYGSRFGRVFNNPFGSVFNMAMHASSAAIQAPDQVVLHREDAGSAVNVGCYGGEYPYKGMDGVYIRSAAVVPRISSSMEQVSDFRVVAGRPPGAEAWAVEVPGVGTSVRSLVVSGLDRPVEGPVVWIVSGSDTVSFDISLCGVTALSFHIVDFKAALGTVDLDRSRGYVVGYPVLDDGVGGWVEDDGGYCYLQLFRASEHERVKRELGEWPSIRMILRCDEFDFNHAALSRCGFQKTDRGWHVAEGLPSRVELLLRIAACSEQDSEASERSLKRLFSVVKPIGYEDRRIDNSGLLGPY